MYQELLRSETDFGSHTSTGIYGWRFVARRKVEQFAIRYGRRRCSFNVLREATRVLSVSGIAPYHSVSSALSSLSNLIRSSPLRWQDGTTSQRLNTLPRSFLKKLRYKPIALYLLCCKTGNVIKREAKSSSCSEVLLCLSHVF